MKFGILVFCLTAFKIPAAVLMVPAGGNLQQTLNAAQPGDVVVLAPGATYVGNYYLPPNRGVTPITIESAAIDKMPAPGTRVSPIVANLMPKIVTPNPNPALSMTTGASHYRIVGLEFRPQAGVYVQDLITAGVASETSVAALPSDIQFQRDYIHGDPQVGGKRGIALNDASTVVRDCYLSDFFSTWQDTQALEGWNGPGPFQIINNYLEAGTETVGFGGAVPSIPGVVPSDILIQNNTFSRPMRWFPSDPNFDGVWRWVKNHLELKSAQRVTITNNLFENNWKGADQRGFFIVFTVRTEVNQVPWAVVNDIKVTGNHFRHGAAGFNITGHDDNPPGSGASSGFLIQNNLFEDISDAWGGDGRMFQLLGCSGITIDHNTIFQNGYLVVFDFPLANNIVFTNNIANVGQGIVGDGAGWGASAWNAFVQGTKTITNNVLIGGDPGRYPAGNNYVGSIDDVKFSASSLGQYNLLSTSPFAQSDSGGKAPGSYVAPIVVLSATAKHYLAESNTGTLGIMAPPQAKWVAQSDTPWLILTGNASGSGNATIQFSIAANATGAGRTSVITVTSNLGNQAMTVTQSGSTTGAAQPLQFVPLSQPCRAVDTRVDRGPILGNTSREFPVASVCGIPSSAQAFALNVTVVPLNTLDYITVWPTGGDQPFASTLNSYDGRIKANAAITLAGTNQSVSVYSTDDTQLILDVTGFFVPAGTPGALSFYPVTPCRVMDTREASGALGGPSLTANTPRTIPIGASSCGLPGTAQAYSMNVTALPHSPMLYITLWPSGQSQPATSTLNAPTGATEANATIIPSGVNGDLQAFSVADADLVLDVNGYFAAPGAPGALNFYSATPCRSSDPRAEGTFLPTAGVTTISLFSSGCAVPSNAQSYVLNATAVPSKTLSYLTLWPANGVKPLISTLNAYDGAITSNLAIVPGNNGFINAFTTEESYIIFDLMGYFAP